MKERSILGGTIWHWVCLDVKFGLIFILASALRSGARRGVLNTDDFRGVIVVWLILEGNSKFFF